MNIERMKKLFNFLDIEDSRPESDPEKIFFNVHGWISIDVNKRCHACAIGMALKHRLFINEGFWEGCWPGAPHFEGLDGFEAIEKFFDIKPELAKSLFSSFENVGCSLRDIIRKVEDAIDDEIYI